jgi:hypothetical protein
LRRARIDRPRLPPDRGLPACLTWRRDLTSRTRRITARGGGCPPARLCYDALVTARSIFPVPVESLVPSDPPVFCFTTDVEWAPEWAIAEVLSFFRERSLPLTPFLTHASAVLDEHYDQPGMRGHVQLHPNFLPGSTHGSTREEVIDTVFGLWPDARGFRCHCFFDESRTVYELKRRGMLYDSNLGLFLQPNCVPLLHNTGLVRFPVFWEDYSHFWKGLPFDFGAFRPYFDGPGLKVINVHPLLFALNVPTIEFYASSKHLNTNPDPASGIEARFRGAGSRTFLEALADHVLTRQRAAVYLDDLYRSLL